MLRRRVASFAVTALWVVPAHAQSTATTPAQSSSDPAPATGEPPVDQPVTTSRLPAPTAAPAEGAFERYNDLQLKGWDIVFPRVEDSIIADKFGIREALADHGIGLFGAINSSFQYDILQNDRGYAGPQLYNGQKLTRTISAFNVYGTYDLGKIGLSGGQLSSSFSVLSNSLRRVNGPHFARISRLNYYQELFNDAVEFKVGLIENSFEFFGSSVGGSFATGNLGPLANIPYQIGVSYGGVAAPGVNVRFNFKSGFYDKIGIQRSLTPGGATAEVEANPSGFRFSPPGTRALIINEFGYRRPSAKSERSLWLRGGGIYNATRFRDYAGTGTRTNHAVFFATDAQATQPDQSRPYRGYYAGFTYNAAPSRQNLVNRYYEVRGYGLGVIESRPNDLASIVASYTGYSDVARRALAGPGATSYDATMSVIASYGYRLVPGLYLQPGLGVTVHPIYSPKFGTALNGYLSVSALF